MCSVCKKIFFTVSVVLWMGMIFYFSSKPAVESAEMSHTVGYVVGEIFVDGFAEWSEGKKQEFAEKIDYPVRKGAHAAEYAILGFLIIGTIQCFDVINDKNWIASWGIGTIYAISDEYHQLFVPGRSGQLSDILLDSIGVILGICLYVVIKSLFYRKKTNIL